MINKSKCASCNKIDSRLVVYGGWYYHQSCLDNLLAGVYKTDNTRIAHRLNKAFNRSIKS